MDMTRKDLIMGAGIAATVTATMGISTALASEQQSSAEADLNSTIEPEPVASVRVPEPGFNAGWGDTELDDPSILETPFGEVIDNWFQYGWSYIREFEDGPAEGEKKHVCILDFSPTIGGNNDTIAAIAAEEIGDQAEVEILYMRDYNITKLQQYGDIPPLSQDTWTQRDGLVQVVEALHRSSVVIVCAPCYYNNLDGSLLTFLARTWACTWKNPNYNFGPVKRTAVMTTSTGTKADYIKTCVRGIFTMADLSIISPEYKSEHFMGCGSTHAIADNEEAIEKVRAMARWAIA